MSNVKSAPRRSIRRRARQPDAENKEAHGVPRVESSTPDMLELQRMVGNQAVQRLVNNGKLQRAPLTAEEKAENLTSPQFAGNPRLEQAYDNAPPLSYGTTHDAVATIQQALIDAGYPMPISTQRTGSPDGIFGRETRDTVKQFQRDHGLKDDGVIGRNTMGELDKMYGAKNKPEIENTEEALGEHMVEGVHKINEGDYGVWYDFNYKAAHPDKWDDDFQDGFANPDYFKRLGYMDWVLLPGKSASKAIKAWLEGLTIAECFTALVAIDIDAMRAALGDERFDELYGSEKGIPEKGLLRIRQDIAGTPLEGVITETDAAKNNDPGTQGKRPVKKGEWYYFYNHPKYLLKHPGGAFQGENAVYMGDNAAGEQLWAGMGVADTTEQGMYEEMAQAYNVERDEFDYQSIIKYHMLTPVKVPPGQPDWKALYEANLDKVQPEYRHDLGHYDDQITADKVLSAEAYTIDGTERKGGFVVDAGIKLDPKAIEDLKKRGVPVY